MQSPIRYASRAGALAVLLWSLGLAAPAEQPVKVFILAGQSNAEGKAAVKLLKYQLSQPTTRPRFAHLQDSNGRWIERDDVAIKFLNRSGKLTVGFGSPGCIGPELEFGNVLGDALDEPVLIIKTAWGGKSLFRDFRPPSAGLPDMTVLQDLLARRQKKNPQTTMQEINGGFGKYYRMMVEDIRKTLKDLDQYVPDYRGQGYELCGFTWFQGWNDMINPAYTQEYTNNLACLIRDLRKDLDAPQLPVVIGVLGVGGKNGPPNPKRDAFKQAQTAVGAIDEFVGNVKIVQTDQYWDNAADAVFKKGWKQHLQEWEKVGSNYPFHYLGSPRTMIDIGRAFGQAILSLQ